MILAEAMTMAFVFASEVVSFCDLTHSGGQRREGCIHATTTTTSINHHQQYTGKYRIYKNRKSLTDPITYFLVIG